MVRGESCPKCGKKTLSYGDLKEWSSWKDYDRAFCRSCGSKFKKENKKWVEEGGKD